MKSSIPRPPAGGDRLRVKTGRAAETTGGCACPSGRVTTLLILKEGLVWCERELCRVEVGEERGGVLESRRKNEKRKMGSEVGRGGNGRVPER